MLALAEYKFLASRVDNAEACGRLFPRTKEDVAAIVATANAQVDKCLKSVVTVDASARDYENTARAADLGAANLAVAMAVLAVTKDTNADKEIRECAANAAVELEKVAIDSFSSNRELYKAFKAVPTSAVEGQSKQRQYWFTEKMAEFKRKGLELPDDQFAKVVSLQKELAELDTKFQTNIAEDNRKIVVPEADVAGVPASIVESLKKVETADGKPGYELGMDYPTYFGVMKNCTVASTRKALSNAFENRAYPDNEAVLHDVIRKRHELANALGFASYAHLDLSDKMAKSPEQAMAFIESLVPKMTAKWDVERQRLLDAGLPESVTATADGNLYNYDLAFVMNHYKQTKLAVDEQRIREYFPLDSTVKALFDIYERFFDVSFATVGDANTFWHKDVTAMSVTDKRTGKLLGHVVLDLFPREGKFSHACCHGILPPVHRDSEGDVSPAVTVVLANFPAASGDKPALFMHDDAQTFFHEFGHAMHYLLGQGEMATTAGYNVKMDFVELPSQMLEEWMWDTEMLRRSTRHYKTGEPLPDDLIQKKIESKRAFSGRDGLRQLVFGIQSLTYFDAKTGDVKSSSDIDSTAVARSIERRILKNIDTNPDGHFQCAFGHLMGYGAGYYGYMWSKVFALDVFGEIKKSNGLLDAQVGRKYSDAILSCGGGRDPNESLVLFLGREPNSDAFFEDMGL